jgi:PKD repeat protein
VRIWNVARTPPQINATHDVHCAGPSVAGSAYDDDRLKNVEISLRNTSTRENLGSDGAWGVNVASGWHRISPLSINATSYNWSYTTPFNLTPGSYSFAVRATDTEDLTTASANQGRLTISAEVPGDAPPNGLLTNGGTITVTDPAITLSGAATDDKGVASVQLVVFDNDTGRYLQPNGTMTSDYTRLEATLASPSATSTPWSRSITLPTAGDFSVTALAIDTVGQQDGNTSGATARLRYYPGDNPPAFEDALNQPIDGASFTEGKIVVTGRAVDDIRIARVEVAIINAAGQYMSSTGTFSSTTPSWRTAYLNSPGSQGSNFSYTTPVIPAGTYQVQVRPMDHHDQYGTPRTASNIVVTLPANNPPVAAATVSCQENVCTFDGRGSTDESPASLVYSWNFGPGQGSANGSVPTKRFTAAGTFPVTLTVRDEWNATATTTLPVTITEPAGNQAPTPVLLSSCLALACSVSSTGSTDPNVGDTVTYRWSFGDGSATVTGPTATRTYTTPGVYTVSLTATDGWGKSTTVTRTLDLR